MTSAVINLYNIGAFVVFQRSVFGSPDSLPIQGHESFSFASGVLSDKVSGLGCLRFEVKGTGSILLESARPKGRSPVKREA